MRWLVSIKAFLLSRHKDWQTEDGKEVKRYVDGVGWEVRPITAEEAADFESRDAW